MIWKFLLKSYFKILIRKALPIARHIVWYQDISYIFGFFLNLLISTFLIDNFPKPKLVLHFIIVFSSNLMEEWNGWNLALKRARKDTPCGGLHVLQCKFNLVLFQQWVDDNWIEMPSWEEAFFYSIGIVQ